MSRSFQWFQGDLSSWWWAYWRRAAALVFVAVAATLVVLEIQLAPARTIPAPAQISSTAMVVAAPVTVTGSDPTQLEFSVAKVALASGRVAMLEVPKNVAVGSLVPYWQRQDTGAVLARPFPATFVSGNSDYLLLEFPAFVCAFIAYSFAKSASRRGKNRREFRRELRAMTAANRLRND